MDTLWNVIGIVFVGGVIYGIHRKGELDYLEEKKVRDYNLSDILSILLVVLLILLFIRLVYSVF